MSQSAYIPAVAGGSNYYYALSLLDYEDIPIVFVAVDDSNQVFLCNCVESRQLQRWIISETDYSILSRVVEGKLSVYDALTRKGKVTVAEYQYSTGIFTQQVNCECSSLPDRYFPDHKTKLLHTPSDVLEDVRAICFSVYTKQKIKYNSGSIEYTTTTESKPVLSIEKDEAVKQEPFWFLGAA